MAAAALVLVVSGCSFVVVRGSTDQPRGERPRCTRSVVGPVIDTVLVAALVGVAVAAQLELNDLGPPPPDGDHTFDRELERLKRDASIVGAAVFAGSATYGYVNTARCRALVDADAPPK